ncbi:MAG: hypothetical protein BWY74_00829 [Firmicutes bacterium ADurb.Bin419]|nr:MAG: hypothetical protein BWY74_00829 [Firmicutes bacterium ADurb.Bin419]
MNKISEFIIRFSGSASVPNPLKIDHDYVVGAKFNIFGTGLSSNSNGTYRKIFKAKPTGEIAIKDDLGEKIYGTTKGESMSKKWRNVLYVLGEDYDEFMPKMISHAEEIVETINKLN